MVATREAGRELGQSMKRRVATHTRDPGVCSAAVAIMGVWAAAAMVTARMASPHYECIPRRGMMISVATGRVPEPSPVVGGRALCFISGSRVNPAAIHLD